LEQTETIFKYSERTIALKTC